MEFLVSASTDIGIKKSTNQDSLTVKLLNTPKGKMVFALLCDGMGGLSSGEIASASVVNAFEKWLKGDFQKLLKGEITQEAISSQWIDIVVQMNQKIGEYGRGKSIKLGTTVTAMLLTQTDYYILNVGDTRAYEISDNLYQLTVDQTLVQREVEEGKITAEQALTDPRRSVLLQCCGASETVVPEMFYGQVKTNSVYMICSDGFRHEIAPYEIYQCFHPDVMVSEESMQNSMLYLIDQNKQRMENDNISVITIRTYDEV